MPTFIHGKGTAVYINQFDMSEYLTSADTTFTQETADSTGFGSSSRSFIVGLQSATMGLSGMWSADATSGSDVVLESLLASTTNTTTTVAMQSGTIGNRCIIMQSDEVSYNVSSPVGDIVSLTADFQASTNAEANMTYAAQSGVQLTTGASIAFGAVGALTAVDNAASTANGGMAALHVPVNSVAGGATTIKVQHSADNSSWADLITFTAVAATAVTSQLNTTAATVNRYLRATASTAGSSGAITFMVSFARF